MKSVVRTRWAAVGAAVAVTLGAGGIGLVNATTPSEAVAFVPITPCRVIDTRPDPAFNVGDKTTPLGPNETHDVTATGNAGKCTAVPTTATGVVMNVTTLGATLPTFITIWETGQPQPDASSLNPTPGQPPTPNAVTTAINSAGQFNIFNLQGSVHVLADIVGYYVDHHHDDRYFTRTQSDDRYATPAEVTAALDGRLALPGQVNVWFDQFTAQRSEDDLLRGSVNTNDGVWLLPGTSSGSGEIGAPVDLPDGATITGVTAFMLDNSATPANYIQAVLVCHQIPTGPVAAGGVDSRVRLRYGSTSGANTAAATFAPVTMTPWPGSPDPLVVDTDTCAYGIEVGGQAATTWNVEGGNLKLLGVTIDYTLNL